VPIPSSPSTATKGYFWNSSMLLLAASCYAWRGSCAVVRVAFWTEHTVYECLCTVQCCLLKCMYYVALNGNMNVKGNTKLRGCKPSFSIWR
jgi:hypothetical protein